MTYIPKTLNEALGALGYAREELQGVTERTTAKALKDEATIKRLERALGDAFCKFEQIFAAPPRSRSRWTAVELARDGADAANEALNPKEGG